MSKKDDDFLALALERFRECEDASREIYDAALSDLKFCVDQWPENLRKTRQMPGKERPIVTDDRISAIIHKIANDQRQNRSQGRVKPLSEGADQERADVYTGVIRHIQYNGDSETAFDTSFESAVRCSIGFHRIVTEYCDNTSFDQEIKVKRIENPFTVLFPLHQCHEIDFSDAEYCFAFNDMPRKEFEEKYPKEELKNWNTSGLGVTGWLTEKTVRVCEYFYVEHDRRKLYKLTDGTISDTIPEGQTAESERDVDSRSIKWSLFSACAVLEEGDFPGEWLPVIPVIGEELNVEGKKVLKSAIRASKDPQRMVNYYSAQEMELIALAPKAPWIAYEKVIEGYEDTYAASNIDNIAVLKAKAVTGPNGVLLPLPERSQAPQMSTAIVTAKREYIDSIKATSGIFDASLGAQGNETSRVAINARQRQGDTANFHFPDNLAKSMCHTWRVILSIIPVVYDTEREIAILGEDMSEEVVRVNSAQPGMVGNQKHVGRLDVGKYGVVVDTGPSYLSKKQETTDNLLKMAETDPVVQQSTRDLVAKAIDMPTDVVQRLAKTIPPNLLDNPNGEPSPDALKAQVAQMTGEMQQMHALIGQLDTACKSLTAEVNDKNVQRAHEAQIVNIKANTEIEKARIENAHQLGMAAHANAIQANPALIEQLVGNIQTIATRLDNLESAVGSPAPTQPAGSNNAGVTP
jgi:hypothetical protein